MYGLRERSAGSSGGGLLPNRCVNGDMGGLDAKLGFLREYFVAVRAPEALGSKLSDWNRVLLNPRIRRFFSSEAPKKKSMILSLKNRCFVDCFGHPDDFYLFFVGNCFFRL